MTPPTAADPPSAADVIQLQSHRPDFLRDSSKETRAGVTQSDPIGPWQGNMEVACRLTLRGGL